MHLIGNMDLNLKVGNSTLNVKFDDWMFLQEDGYLINIAKVKKVWDYI